MSTHSLGSDFAVTRDAWRRGRCLGALCAAALLLHALAFSGLDWAWPQREPPPLPAAAHTPMPAQMRVRVVDARPASAAPASVIVAKALTAAPTPPMPTPMPSRAKPAVIAAVSRARPPESTTEASVAARPEESAAVGPLTSIAAVDTSASPMPSADDETIPRYRTHLPPPVTLRYELRRGGASGSAELSWRPQAERYELRLDASLGGALWLTQASAGGFDAAGVAPLRFTDRRGRKATTAANFQREARKITFSRSAAEFALHEGAQDRLSWLIQLAAIVAGEPQRALPGATLAMRVVGAQGDVGVWVFRCIGPEAVQTRAGTVDAVSFVREAREAYDTTVQVWLDPLQHGLPVRVRQKSAATDATTEWLLAPPIALP